MLQNFARQDITLQKNPFIVNHWFNILEETVKKLGIEDRSDLICNSDESGLPSEPKKCKVNSLKGKLYKLWWALIEKTPPS